MPIRKLSIFIKRIVFDEIFIFRDFEMPVYQKIEKDENIAKTNFFNFAEFSYRHYLGNVIINVVPVSPLSLSEFDFTLIFPLCILIIP